MSYDSTKYLVLHMMKINIIINKNSLIHMCIVCAGLKSKLVLFLENELFSVLMK